MKRIVYFSLFSLICFNNVTAQDNCKVLVEALKGSYTGDCKDGKANGQGKAVGSDTYEGEFKLGLPEGSGTYIWADKSVYAGYMKKGLMDGSGELTYRMPSGKDSVVTGF